jgi:hypothetical protein
MLLTIGVTSWLIIITHLFEEHKGGNKSSKRDARGDKAREKVGIFLPQ